MAFSLISWAFDQVMVDQLFNVWAVRAMGMFRFVDAVEVAIER
jgi:hypothetical protein